ncbi:hypothetical protein BH18ACT13_BH18ACT13_17370 [soil metagenome]
MPLALAQQRRRLYTNNPIKIVVCQVRFPLLTTFDQPGFLAPLQESLSGRFPRVSQEQQLGMTLGPQGVSQMPPTSLWRFNELDGPWTIALGRDFLALETQVYRRYEELVDRLAEAIDVLGQIGVQVRERIGLRYVNRLADPEARRATDWRRFIRHELLGVVGGPELGDDVVQAIQQIRLREPDGFVVIHHGYLSDEVAGNDGAHYLIDIDVFDERAVRFDPDETLKLIDSYHERLKDLFEISITDEMRSHLVIEEELDV